MLIPIANSDVAYHFVAFDKKGKEIEQSTGFGSMGVLDALADTQLPVTDVFLVSHGWKGDRPAALDQCNRWIGKMAEMADDRAHVRGLDANFKPLIIGLHWPSQPWGDESEKGAESGLLGDDAPDRAEVEKIIDTYMEALELEVSMRPEVSTIVKATPRGKETLKLESEVRAAYEKIAGAAITWSDDGSEAQKEWSAQKSYNDAVKPDADAGLLGGSAADFFLTPLRQLSFWTMKDRARKVGETGVAKLVRDIQAANVNVRVHMMGHSFGCIVVSAAVAGRKTQPLPRPVSSLLLVQGALSLWAYSTTPDSKDGYFRRIVDDRMIRGPIITTWSKYDKAVGNLYPIAARVAKQSTLADLPKYGGTGAFGLHGGPDFAVEMDIRDSKHVYPFQAGKIYNVRSEAIIANRDGISGAHSDIVHPEVAHLAWSGIFAGVTAKG